jgi:hypothetical protein
MAAVIIVLYVATLCLQTINGISKFNFYFPDRLKLDLVKRKWILSRLKKFFNLLNVENLERISRRFFEFMVTMFLRWLVWKIFCFFMAYILDKFGYFDFMGEYFMKLHNLFDLEVDRFCSIFAQEMEVILKTRNLFNPLTCQQWKDFFKETIGSSEGLKIFRSLLIEIINNSIGIEKIDNLVLIDAFDNPEKFILMPRSNSNVDNLIKTMKRSSILWRFSRHCNGYDFDLLMKLLKSYYFKGLPYQLAQVKDYLDIFKNYVVVIVITK